MLGTRETMLEGNGLASDTRINSYVESLSDGVLWLRPGVRRTIPLPVFQELFRDYDIVCRAVRDCTLEHKTESGSEQVAFKAGDAIAAISADLEDLLYQKLEQAGVDEDAVTLEPGANWHRAKPSTRDR